MREPMKKFELPVLKFKFPSMPKVFPSFDKLPITMERRNRFGPAGLLYYNKIKIEGTTIYNLTNGNVAVLYEDHSYRFIKNDWFDDEQFEEPTDDAIEQIVLEALEDALKDPKIEHDVWRDLVGAPNESPQIAIRYANEILTKLTNAKHLLY